MVLRYIFGDQLSHQITSLAEVDPAADLVLMCEVKNEATRVRHHKKKIAFIFSAMRHFAEELRVKGIQVRYVKYDDAGNSGSFTGELQRALAEHAIDRVIVTAPSEYAVAQEVGEWETGFSISVEVRQDDRFLCTPAAFAQWAQGRKQVRMEHFYREMRKRHSILMDGANPVGGQWNYDSENRKAPKVGLKIPETYQSQPDTITQEVLQFVEAEFSDHFGELESFHFAVNAEQAQQALQQFIKQRLSQFGDYQDAMLQNEPWMYHSHLSLYINCGLLDPLECIQAAEAAYRAGQAPLNAVEGFIRQILGWREYVRGLYWLIFSLGRSGTRSCERVVLDRLCGCVSMGRVTQCLRYDFICGWRRDGLQALCGKWSLHQSHV